MCDLTRPASVVDDELSNGGRRLVADAHRRIEAGINVGRVVLTVG